MTQEKRVQVLLSEEEWQMIGEVMESNGFRTYSDALRYLIRKERRTNETS